ncbi:sphinganine hydroxylase [Lasallia pustulata]|uniref:Sphinganine hydroxylase n=1 Tax=Lasallia pustulata TaxID=136370 RepID=A0A1W5D6S4_9LECA|nr:sphinganine hydroxylase [Lasallia pustulata]
MFELLDFERRTLPIPPATLAPRPSIFPSLADHHLPYIVPALVYWIIGLTFHYIEKTDFLSAYKLHTPAEFLKKNRATRRDVIKFALIQQAGQILLGYWMAEASEVFHSDHYSVAAWALTIRRIQVFLAHLIHYFGFTSVWAAQTRAGTEAVFANSVIQDSISACLHNSSQAAYVGCTAGAASFTRWEWASAELVYWIIVPAIQYATAMALADSFQYFTHRTFHVNKWLYKHIHSMHHDVYVPFAYGAFYNHPLETIPIDSIGFPICLGLAGLNNRQAALFGAIWTFKTVVDHCGYNFPYNPCNIICPNSVLFHDLHHQTWGMKYNFSVYTSFWDWIMGTHWAGEDSKAQKKYTRGKEAAERALAKDKLISEVSEEFAAVSTARDL